MTGEVQSILSPGPNHTARVGEDLASTLSGGEVILLQGSMGAGKTELARGIITSLGNVDWRGSPTFSLINEYATTPKTYHIDLYRLGEAEVDGLGLEEYFRADTVVIVEWPERARRYIEELAGQSVIHINLEIITPEERLIEVTRPYSLSPASVTREL